MEKSIKIKRGLDLRIAGEAPEFAGRKVEAKRVAISPLDFPGFIPKLDVKEGMAVAIGSPLMHHKDDERLCLVSPVAGRVSAVVRGERRKILNVVIDVEPSDADAPVAQLAEGAEIEFLAKAGLLALVRQRPYDIVPSVDKRPRDIFVTAFDSSPLAPSLIAQAAGREEDLRRGIELLSKATDGRVYVGVPAGAQLQLPESVERVVVAGPHPSGNAGVLAANVAPVNKGEMVWTLDITTVLRIGACLSGRRDWSARVAVVGPEVVEPCVVETQVGASVESLVAGNLKVDDGNLRVISGNVLTGVKVAHDGYLRYPYRQLTVIKEGDDVDEFMGWASLSPKKMSVSRSFPSRLFGKKAFSPDARLLGGRRAMIMSGLYDDVMPMDIVPEYLIKAIIARDIDKMEALGIYEVAPEDFALCEYVDPSKLELQKIVREGLDYLRKELE